MSSQIQYQICRVQSFSVSNICALTSGITQFLFYVTCFSGGFLVGLHLDSGSTAEPDSHFDPNRPFGSFYINRYMIMGDHVRELRTVLVRDEL